MLGALLVTTALAFTPAEAPPSSPYQLSLEVDLSLTLGFAAIAGGTQAVIMGGEVSPTTLTAPEDLFWMDRSVVESRATHELRQAAITSDVLAGVGLAWTLIGPGITWILDDGHEAAVDLALYSETLTFTLALMNVVKLAVRRPRPIEYLEPSDGSDSDRYLSFYSGHTAVVAALGATATTIAFHRKRPAWARWLTLGVAAGTTLWVGIERTLARDHFPTDVLVGAAVGAATGVLVPVLHRAIAEED